MSFIFAPKRKDLPFLIINKNNFSLPDVIVRTSHMMWPENNALSLSNLLKEVL
jgi:hypothetical protein